MYTYTARNEKNKNLKERYKEKLHEWIKTTVKSNKAKIVSTGKKRYGTQREHKIRTRRKTKTIH